MLNRPRTHVPRQALRQGLLAELAELRIPSRQPVPPNDPAPSLYAIGLSAISNGLYVFVPPYSGMNNGDYIEVFWDNSNIPAASDTVNDGNKNTAIGLPLPASSFANGRFTPYYRVTRGGSGLPLYSLTQNIWVKLNPPGGLDPNPGTPEHENLRAPILPEDVRDGLDNDRAALGVDVTIPPYPQMAEYDRIDFSWGGSGGGIRHIYTVQPDEVGRPVVVHITESEILSAGDGDVLLMYTVIDAALNRTADGKWSLTTRLNVLANNSHLDAPYIVEVNENEDIDLTELGDADATAVVYADNIDFAVGDDITFTWAGFDAYGTALTPYTDTQRVTRVPRPVLFIVPNATVVASAQGRAVLSFMLHKSNGETIDSRHSTVRIVGKAASDLPPPIVTPSLLPADVVRADVTVLAYDGMDVGDHVTLIWTGMGADNRLVDYRPTFDVTQAWVGQDLPPFPIDGPAYIAPLAGGRVTVSYQVDYAAGPALVRESAPLELPVGDAGNRLPPPFVIEAPDGIFDPTLTLANVRIPGTVLVANDRVNLTWVGDTTGTYTDSAIARTTGQALNMVVPAARITGNRQITVSYAVNGGPASTTLTLRVAASGDLPIPEVDQANNGVLALGNVPASGATGRVRPYTGIATNDQVTLFLEEPAGTVQWQRTETVTSTTQDLTYTIPRSVIAGLLNRTVQLRYAVQLAGVSKGQSAVAHLSVEDGAASERPVIEVIRNPQNVDIPNGGTTGATSLTLSGTAARDQRVQIFDGTNASLGIANVNSMGRWSLPVAGLSSGPHTLTAEGLYDDFPVSDVYRLTITLSGHLLVMGGRSTSPMRGGFHGSAALRTSRRRLHALDATTKKSILARWRYQFELDSTGITATDFLDLEPDAVLYIDTDDDQVILRPRNILGNGVSTTSYGGAFVAQRDEGNLVAWGSTNMGGTLPPVLPGLTDIVEFKTSFGAFAARRNNGKNGASGAVVAWGNSGYGGTFPANSPIPGLTDIVEIISNGYAFAARRVTDAGAKMVTAWGYTSYGGSFPNGSPIPGMTDIVEVVATAQAFAARRSNGVNGASGAVVAWGDNGNGGNVPLDVARRTDIVEVVGNVGAFAAICDNRAGARTVVAWGNGTYGGTFPNGSVIPGLTDIVQVTSNTYAFAARRENGTVVVWGNSSYGGTFPNGSPIPGMTDVVEVIANTGAFAAIRDNRAGARTVVVWGNTAGGGSFPNGSIIPGLTDIVEVIGNDTAFAARRSNGTVVVWGDASTGGSFPNGSVIPGLTDIVDVVGNFYAFAALRSNGSVVAWGNADYGGQIPQSIVPLLTNVRAIYPSFGAFAALTEDGRVVVWGHSSYGGANNTVPSTLQGNISYELKAAISQDDSPRIAAPRKRRHRKPELIPSP